jgi:hypothetical protein
MNTNIPIQFQSFIIYLRVSSFISRKQHSILGGRQDYLVLSFLFGQQTFVGWSIIVMFSLDFNERFKQMKKIWRKVPTDAKQNYTQRARLNRTQRRALKSTSSQSSNTSKGTKRKNSAKQQSSEPEDNNNDGGGGSESRSSTPSSSTTNETTTVIVHPTEHQEHPAAHLYQQPRQMYSPGSGNLMVGTPNSTGSFHHQPYPTQQRPQQQQQG